MQLHAVHQEVALTALLSVLLCACGEETRRATQVVAGSAHSCALDDAGGVWCWGGSGAFEPTAQTGLPTVTQLSAGDDHTCALDEGGGVWCWGVGSRGQLGDVVVDFRGPERVAIGAASRVAAGDLHTCAIVSGEVLCWGDNSTGQLGIDATVEPVPTPVTVAGVSATWLNAGGIEGVSRTCAIDADQVTCWGHSQKPADAFPSVAALRVDVGADHLCAVATSGALSCKGSAPDQAVADLQERAMIDVGTGGLHSCALENDGTVWCFGDDLNGQLGDGEGDSSGGLGRVLSGAADIGVGSLHSCAVLTDGQIRCWGENNNGRLGNGASGSQAHVPVTVVGFGG